MLATRASWDYRGVVLRWIAGTISATLALAGCFLLGRRWAGALEQPLGFEPLAVIAAGLIGLQASAQFSWHASLGRPRLARRTAWPWILGALLPATAALLVAAALSLPGTRTGALLFFWSVLLGGLAATGAAGFALRDRLAAAAGRGAWPAGPSAGPGFSDPPSRPPGSSTSDDRPETLVQQITRHRDQTGREWLEATLREPIAPGERTLSLHIAFCPPLAAAPAVQCWQVAGPAAVIRVTQAESFGVRLDVRLQRAAQASTLLEIELEAHAAADDTPPAEADTEHGPQPGTQHHD